MFVKKKVNRKNCSSYGLSFESVKIFCEDCSVSCLVANAATTDTRFALVPKRKAVRPNPFGLTSWESFWANQKCVLFVQLVDVLTA